MDEYMNKIKEEAEKEKLEMIDFMYRKTFDNLLLFSNEYIESKINIKFKEKLLNGMEKYFVGLEEYEKCNDLIKIKNKIKEHHSTIKS